MIQWNTKKIMYLGATIMSNIWYYFLLHLWERLNLEFIILGPWHTTSQNITNPITLIQIGSLHPMVDWMTTTPSWHLALEDGKSEECLSSSKCIQIAFMQYLCGPACSRCHCLGHHRLGFVGVRLWFCEGRERECNTNRGQVYWRPDQVSCPWWVNCTVWNILIARVLPLAT